MSSLASNTNDARSAATRARLIDSAIQALVEVGFSKTTGVEVCRRAGVTRGALNHHFPDFAELLVASLQSLYAQLLDAQLLEVPNTADGVASSGPVGTWVQRAYTRVIQPQFKAVIELWLASRNDAEFGQRLGVAIEQSATLFSPEMLLTGVNKDDASVKAIYRTVIEALIGLGLGRAVNHGQPVEHETDVLAVLTNLARSVDENQNN